MNKITFGEDLGILDAGKDVTGFLEISAQDSDYFARVCTQWFSCPRFILIF